MTAKTNLVALAGVSTYPAAPQVALAFWPDLMVFKLEAGDGCHISFDGVEDQLRLVTGDPALVIPLRYTKIWLRCDGDADPTTVRVFAANVGSNN
jgi:hypothetical protein